MNANELADELIASGGQYMMNIGFMLRQQQAEIEALKELLDRFGITVALKRISENEQ